MDTIIHAMDIAGKYLAMLVILLGIYVIVFV
jgi:hypothetical protein